MDGDQTNANFTAAGLAAIEPALQGVVDAGDLSGFVTLIWRKGEIVQVNTVGHRDIAASLPMTRDTLFRIASMTKPVTSVAALMLMEEGKLSLEDPVTKWLPELAGMRVMKDPEGAIDDTYPAPRDITVEDLLTHRSGLSYDFTAIGPIAKAYSDALASPIGGTQTPDAWLKALGGLPLLYPPGERFHYSVSTDVLGFLVGRVEGKAFGEVLKDRIFGPLGMVDTDFWCPPEKRDRMAKLYRQDQETGRLDDVSFPHHPRDAVFEGGGGALVSTVDDYLKFARMLLGDGEVDGVRLLKPETVTLMRQNRLTDAQRAIPFMGLPFWIGQGVTLDAQAQAWAGPNTNGAFSWPGAFGTWWRADPAEDMIAIYMIQNSMPLTPDAAAQVAASPRMGGRLALMTFLGLLYAALGR